MSSPQPEPSVPQYPPRKWVVSKTGHFWQELVVPQACVICGEVRTLPKTFNGIAGRYTLRYFACLHPQDTKAGAAPKSAPPPRSGQGRD